ncbi:MAG: hypothetical protein JST44_24870 [Cyanobacteria bacterium SZAS LIN-5]|nr:hypothetical protein [Cyanobacteria bacterium SZAS LIN-5]
MKNTDSDKETENNEKQRELHLVEKVQKRFFSNGLKTVIGKNLTKGVLILAVLGGGVAWIHFDWNFDIHCNGSLNTQVDSKTAVPKVKTKR